MQAASVRKIGVYIKEKTDVCSSASDSSSPIFLARTCRSFCIRI